MSIHPAVKSCSNLGRVLVLIDPPTRCWKPGEGEEQERDDHGGVMKAETR